jgi:phosphate/sulfate permease
LIHDQAALMLVIGTYVKIYAIPVQVILLCAGMIDLGTSLSGWELIRTLQMIIHSSGSL